MAKKHKNCRKLLYKRCLKYRTNLQHQKRTKYSKFRKRKWINFLRFLKRTYKRRRNHYKIYDVNKYKLPKITEMFSRKYRNILQNKQKTCFYYGGLKKKFWKKHIKALSNKKSLMKHSAFKHIVLLNILEKRLDVILYRSHFAYSVRNARQLIKHSHIEINGSVVTKSSMEVKNNDKITIKASVKDQIYKNIKNSSLWPIPPKYLVINYKTFEIIFIDQVANHNFSINFPTFLPNFYLLIRFLKYI